MGAGLKPSEFRRLLARLFADARSRFASTSAPGLRPRILARFCTSVNAWSVPLSCPHDDENGTAQSSVQFSI